MENSGMLGSGAKATGSVVQNLLNQVFRCRHRHKTFPFTPRGEERCYAVCLDCGQRLGSDMQVIETAPKVDSSHETRRAGVERFSVPIRPGTVVKEPSPPDRGQRNWRYNSLWIGLVFVFGLSGGLYFSGQIHANHTVPTPAQPSVPSASLESPIEKQKRVIHPPSSPNGGDKTLLTMATVPSGAEPGARKERGRIAFSASEDIARSNHTWRVESKSSIVILGLEAPAVFELSEHPGRLEELVQSGSLFTVPRGTAIQVREVENAAIKVLILKGSMAGREGWVQASQVTPRYRLAEGPRREK